MSISVTVSGEDSTSIILTQPQTGLISISGDQFIDVTASSGDSATIIVSSGDPITITGNYSNYVTGDVVRPPEIADFLTENQINSKITTATGDYNTLATNLFYPKSNPSGYITGVDLSAYTTEEFVTGISGSLQGQISSNDSEITEIVNSTGSFALKSETGSFISDSETGQFYASSNPSGFITGVNLSSYVQNSETGLFLVSGQDANVSRVLATSGSTSAQLSVLSDNANYPRAGFKINSGGSATNYGFSIRNDSATDSETFLEVVNAAEYSATTSRAFIRQTTTALTIRTAKDNGNVAGTPIVFSTKANQDAAITIPSDSTNVNFGSDVDVNGELTTAGLNSSDNIVITDNTKGLSLMSTAGNRYGLKYGLAGVLGGSDHLMLTNREANGDLLFGTSPGGGAGNEVERMRITSDGNVGIGTSSPDELLHLEATSQSSTREVLMKATVSDAGNDQFGIGNGTSVNSNFAPSFYGYKDSNYGNGYIYSMNFRGLIPSSQDTTQTNRFGIVHFEAYTSSSATDPNNSLVGGVSNRKVLTVANGGDTLVNIEANGNVGIGTTSPDQSLHINRDQNAATNIKIENSNTGVNSTAGMNFHSATADGYYFLHGANRTTSRYGLPLADWVELTHGGSDDLNGIVIGTRTDIPVVIGANNNEVARFTDNGVGIGTTTPSEKLEVSGNLMLQQNGVIKNNNNNTQFRFDANAFYFDSGHIRAGYSVGVRGNKGTQKGMDQGSTTSDLGLYCGSNEAISIHTNGSVDVNYNLIANQDLSVSGESSFSSRPTVNGTGVLLSGEGGGGTVENAVYTTGDQTISGTKSFGKISLSENSFVTETGSFTMGSTHRGATVLLQNSAPMTITIPAQVSGHTTTFIAETSNSVVFGTGAGISGFNSFNSANQIAGIYGQAQVIFKSPEYAFLGGNVV